MTKASEANLDKVRHSKWAIMLGVTSDFVDLNFGHQTSQNLKSIGLILRKEHHTKCSK